MGLEEQGTLQGPESGSPSLSLTLTKGVLLLPAADLKSGDHQPLLKFPKTQKPYVSFTHQLTSPRASPQIQSVFI